MTEIKIKRRDGHIIAVTLEGHAGTAVYGHDIVCAAISALCQTAALGLIKVANINAKFSRDELKGYFGITLPEKLTPEQRHDADIILETMMTGLRDIEKGYPKYIKTEEAICL